MLQYGESIQSFFPWDIPLWDPSFVIFLGAFYLVLTTLGVGLGLIIYKTLKDLKNDCESSHEQSDN